MAGPSWSKRSLLALEGIMAEKIWTSQQDFEGWAWTNGDTTTTPGSVLVEAGQVSAVGLSPVYQATGWTSWRAITITGSRPAGTSYYFRFKTGETAGGLGEFSEYIDAPDVGGNIVCDLRPWCLNNPSWGVGPWIQIELTLETD